MQHCKNSLDCGNIWNWSKTMRSAHIWPLEGTCTQTDTFSLYANTFWRSMAEVREEKTDFQTNLLSTLSNTLVTCNQSSALRVLGASPAGSLSSIRNASNTSGFLPYRTHYYGSSALLYYDDFQSRSLMVSKGSIRGCYISSTGFFSKTQRGIDSVRKISISLSKVSTNRVLDFIMESGVRRCTEVVPSTDTCVAKWVIAGDIDRSLADSFDSLSILDMMSHSAHSLLHTLHFSKYCMQCTSQSLTKSRQLWRT